MFWHLSTNIEHHSKLEFCQATNISDFKLEDIKMFLKRCVVDRVKTSNKNSILFYSFSSGKVTEILLPLMTKNWRLLCLKWALFLKWVFAKFDLLFTIIYYKMRRTFITKCISLLQNASVLTINYWLRLIFWIKLFGSQVYVRQYVFIMRDIILRGMGMVMNYSVTFKIFLTSNFSRKHEILHFFDNTFIFRSHFMCLCK